LNSLSLGAVHEVDRQRQHWEQQGSGLGHRRADQPEQGEDDLGGQIVGESDQPGAERGGAEVQPGGDGHQTGIDEMEHASGDGKRQVLVAVAQHREAPPGRQDLDRPNRRVKQRLDRVPLTQQVNADDGEVGEHAERAEWQDDHHRDTAGGRGVDGGLVGEVELVPTGDDGEPGQQRGNEEIVGAKVRQRGVRGTGGGGQRQRRSG
jgi:hypothetical protein